MPFQGWFDTSTHSYGTGKDKAHQMLLHDKGFRDGAAVLFDTFASQDDIVLKMRAGFVGTLPML